MCEELWLQSANNQNVNDYCGMEFGASSFSLSSSPSIKMALFIFVRTCVRAEEATYVVRSCIYVVIL